MCVVFTVPLGAIIRLASRIYSIHMCHRILHVMVLEYVVFLLDLFGECTFSSKRCGRI